MKRTVAIIGGGIAGIMLACKLNPEWFDVHIYEQKKSLGRKFLVAGKGGFNLTHSSTIEEMIQQYHPSRFLKPILLNFSNNDLRHFLKSIGIPTYIGTSKRVFPVKGIKPIRVLKALMDQLEGNGVSVHLNCRWSGYSSDGGLKISSPDAGTIVHHPDFVVYALGGSSWKKTGSDGRWLSHFKSRKVKTIPFSPSNCGVRIDWPASFLERWEGHPVKNIVARSGDVYVAGEVLITRYGLEGGAIYALSRNLREQIGKDGYAEISLDLKPTISAKRWKSFHEKISEKLSMTDNLKKHLKLQRVKIALLKAFTDRKDFIDPKRLSPLVKDLKLPITGLSDIDEAISTVGGISLDEVDQNLQLKQLKNHFVIGEMLDWDAPTGGYLLQACISMGVWVADYLNKKRTT